MFDKDAQQAKKQKKEALQAYYKQKNKDRQHQNKATVPTPAIDWKEKYELEKRLRKKSQKDVKKALAKEKVHQTNIQRLKDDLYRAEGKWKDAQKTVASERETIQQLQQTILRLQGQNEALQKKNEAYEELKDKLRTQQKQKDNRRIVQSNRDLREQVQLLKRQNENMKRQLKVNQAIQRIERNQHVQKENKVLRTTVKQLEDTLTSYQNVQKPAHLLKALRHAITPENIACFYENNQNQLTQLASKADSIRWTKRKNPKRKLRLKSLSVEERESRSYMGYLSKKQNIWYFIAVDDEKESEIALYEVVGNATTKRLKESLPVKVFLRPDGRVMVTDVYEENELPERIKQWMKPKEKQTTKEKKSYQTFGNFTVLLIGSRNLHEYKQRLEKHGITVLLHNPFEESYHRIEAKSNKSHVILVCTSHISHSVMDHVDRKAENVELVQRDSEDWIAHCVYISLLRQGLLDTGKPLKEDETEMSLSPSS